MLALAVIGAAQVSCKRKAHKSDDAGSSTEPAKKSAKKPKRPAPPIAVEPLTWVVPEVKLELHAVMTKERDLDATALARRLGGGLRASEFFVADERETPEGRTFAAAIVAGRLSYDVVDEGSTGTPAIIVALEVALLPSNTDYLAVSDNVIIERAIAPSETPADIDAAIAEHASGAVDTAVHGLINKERLRAAPRSDLENALSGTSDMAIWALDLIADRRDAALVDAVVFQFQARDPSVVTTAITTAVALGESSAVGPLTKLADFQDYEQLRVIIEASSALGGDDAIEFLEFVVSGHPDDTIKEHAREALGRLRP